MTNMVPKSPSTSSTTPRRRLSCTRKLSVQTQPDVLSPSCGIISPSPSRCRLDPEYKLRLKSQSCPAVGAVRTPMRSGGTRKKRSGRETRSFFGSPIVDSNRRNSSSGNAVSPGGGGGYSPSHQYQGSENNENTGGYYDRFIPSRATSNLSFALVDSDGYSASSRRRRSYNGHRSGGPNSPTSPGSDLNQAGTTMDASTGGTSGGGRTGTDGTSQAMLNSLLRSELLDLAAQPSSPNSTSNYPSTPQRRRSSTHSTSSNNTTTSTTTSALPTQSIFAFQTPRPPTLDDTSTRFSNLSSSASSVVKPFNISPVSSASTHRWLASPQKRKRRIAKVPFKVLDAPALQDDFYLNLVDWSASNVLAVGLGSCVYLWSACTSKVTKLCDLALQEDVVTSVSWTQRGTHLAVGTNRGEVQLWDAQKCTKVRTMGGHSARVGALSWTGATLASGSRDRLIYLRDVRAPPPFAARLASHKQEVCGLKFSFDEPSHLASGGNDNKLLVWDVKQHTQPLHKFSEHTAAVKAIAWSPHQHGLLASGGGTADRCIRFWNTVSGSHLHCIDTGSQVCNLAWSKNCQEIVSTHGYSLNQIVVWKYPSMNKVATLTGHTYRVLYLAMSPDGSAIVTGAGDETLRFWQVFPGPRSHDKSSGSGLLFPSTPGSIIR